MLNKKSGGLVFGKYPPPPPPNNLGIDQCHFKGLKNRESVKEKGKRNVKKVKQILNVEKKNESFMKKAEGGKHHDRVHSWKELSRETY